MKKLVISAFAAVVLLSTAATMLRSHSIPGPAATSGMPSLDQLHRSARTDKLPVDNFEDRSLIYPSTAQR